MAQSHLLKLKSTLGLNRDYSIQPAGLKWRSNSLFIIITVAVGMFSDLFLYGLVVPILPYLLEDRIGVPRHQIQSHVSGLLAAYAGASVISSPFIGYLADLTESRKAPFLLGLTSLLLSTILLFAGSTVPILVIARLLQGVSAAVVWTIGLALCLETVGPENLGKTIGSIFSFISFGNLVSPILGGVLYSKSGVIGVAGLSFAILVIDFVMRILVIEKKTADLYRQASSENDDNSDSSSQTSNNDAPNPDEEDPLLGPRASSLDEFKLAKDQSAFASKAKILPCLKHPALLTAMFIAFIQALIIGSFDATVATTGQDYFGFDPLQAGLLFLPLGVFDLLIGPLGGWFVDRYGTKPGAVLGFAFLVPVLVCLRIPHEGGKDQIIVYCVLLSLSGMGIALQGAPSIVEAGNVVRKYHDANPEFFGEQGPYAQLYGLNSMVFSLGLTIGPELAGELKRAIGYGNMNLVMAAISLVTAVVSYVWLGGKPRWLDRKREDESDD